MDNSTPDSDSPTVLSFAERSILRILVDAGDKVIGRESLSRMAGLDADSARRVDSCLVAIRKACGPDSLITIRRRGWMLTNSGRRAAEKFLMNLEKPEQ